MRIRTFALIAVLLLPAILPGQRAGIGRGAGRTPRRPAPLPPQAPGIPRLRYYRASRLSVESYPLLSVVQADRYVADGVPSTWTLFGFGGRADWRIKPAFSATGDFTSTVLGGPFNLYTLDLGGRYHPSNEGGRVHPYVDVRASWAFTSNGYGNSESAPLVGSPVIYRSTTGASHGPGALAGAGFETLVSRSLAVTTGLSVSRYGLTSVRYAQYPSGSNWNYHATDFRFTVGLKYNPHRLVTLP